MKIEVLDNIFNSSFSPKKRKDEKFSKMDAYFFVKMHGVESISFLAKTFSWSREKTKKFLNEFLLLEQKNDYKPYNKPYNKPSNKSINKSDNKSCDKPYSKKGLNSNIYSTIINSKPYNKPSNKPDNESGNKPDNKHDSKPYNKPNNNKNKKYERNQTDDEQMKGIRAIMNM
ncbi:MAG: hypothetical protein COA82_01120 [Alkaliphilus sp.]|nr:hypothetical protein [bacterium AH-315-E09]PHS36595.1 MAG: hypothetical protein COA82_01120 [Alkaliphilus sp.]